MLRMVEHTGTQRRLYLDARTEKAYTPKESAEYHCKHNIEHRSADLLNEEVHIKGHYDTALKHDLAAFKAVDYHTVELGYLKLEKVYEQKRQNAE